MGKKFLIIMSIVVVGVIIIYPLVGRKISNKKENYIVAEYEENLSYKPKEEIKEEMRKTKLYNSKISKEEILIDFNDHERNAMNLDENPFKINEVIGKITLCRTELIIPIYVSELENSEHVGAELIANTSIPNGDNDTHSVILIHRGIIKAKIFDNVNMLSLYDIFTIDYLNEKNYYKVTSRKEVSPNETEEIKIEEGKSKITLAGCTELGTEINRVIINAEKITEEEAIGKIYGSYYSEDGGYNEYVISTLIVTSLIFLEVIIILGIIWLGRRRR